MSNRYNQNENSSNMWKRECEKLQAFNLHILDYKNFLLRNFTKKLKKLF